jgi:hypothetical protein
MNCELKTGLFTQQSIVTSQGAIHKQFITELNI